MKGFMSGAKRIAAKGGNKASSAGPSARKLTGSMKLPAPKARALPGKKK